MTCRICHHDVGHSYRVREMMFGTRDEFDYWQCSHCGCLQLVTRPADLASYYPEDGYYAFQTSETVEPSRSWVRGLLKRYRDRAVLFGGRGLAGRTAKRFPNPGIADIVRWIGPTSVRSFDASILDVGCGDAHLLKRFRDLGFSQLTGADPFVPESYRAEGIDLQRKTVNGLSETMAGRSFDLIMLHHSLEHMDDQASTLSAVQTLLADDGVCLVRIPIVSDGPWKEFGTDWAEIDAPRHFFLHTDFSLRIAAESAGLELFRIDYEPEAFAYWASSLYAKDVPLFDRDRNSRTEAGEQFSEDELAAFGARADHNNVPSRACRAAFYLRRIATDKRESTRVVSTRVLS